MKPYEIQDALMRAWETLKPGHLTRGGASNSYNGVLCLGLASLDISIGIQKDYSQDTDFISVKLSEGSIVKATIKCYIGTDDTSDRIMSFQHNNGSMVMDIEQLLVPKNFLSIAQKLFATKSLADLISRTLPYIRISRSPRPTVLKEIERINKESSQILYRIQLAVKHIFTVYSICGGIPKLNDIYHLYGERPMNAGKPEIHELANFIQKLAMTQTGNLHELQKVHLEQNLFEGSQKALRSLFTYPIDVVKDIPFIPDLVMPLAVSICSQALDEHKWENNSLEASKNLLALYDKEN
jgi:hypothetical protein